MEIIPNEESLKKLSCINIGFQFAMAEGQRIFNYTGLATPEYQEYCGNVSKKIGALMQDLEQLKNMIPVSIDEDKE